MSHSIIFFRGNGGSRFWWCAACEHWSDEYADETEALYAAADHVSLYCEARPGTAPGTPGSS